MEKKILIISSTETFTVRGLEMKLKGIGASTSYSGIQVRQLEKADISASLWIVYLDEAIDREADSLVYIKDLCLDNRKRLFLIGTKDECDTAEQFLPDDYKWKFFERPLNMDLLLDEAEKYFEEELELAKRKNILVVDDDVNYLAMVYDWLKDKYRVSVVNSGMQAITWLAKNHVDLILLDYEMPVTDGPKVLEMIRTEVQTADIPVMFLTGKNDRQSIMKVLSLKPDDYLLKTIDQKGLIKKLDDYFEKKDLPR